MQEKEFRDLLLAQVRIFEKEVIAVNDYMAENPETGSEEYNSSRKMVELMRK